MLALFAMQEAEHNMPEITSYHLNGPSYLALEFCGEGRSEMSILVRAKPGTSTSRWLVTGSGVTYCTKFVTVCYSNRRTATSVKTVHMYGQTRPTTTVAVHTERTVRYVQGTYKVRYVPCGNDDTE